jgi:hypothetical protein
MGVTPKSRQYEVNIQEKGKKHRGENPHDTKEWERNIRNVREK